jgi:hypothetical protein
MRRHFTIKIPGPTTGMQAHIPTGFTVHVWTLNKMSLSMLKFPSLRPYPMTIKFPHKTLFSTTLKLLKHFLNNLNISYSRIMVYYSGFGLDRFHCILIKMEHHKFVYLWQINCNHFKWQRFYLWVWSLFGKRLKFCNFYACFDICSIYFLSCLWERLSKPW